MVWKYWLNWFAWNWIPWLTVHRKVRICWPCERCVEWLSELVLWMTLDFGQSLPVQAVECWQVVDSAIPPSLPCQLSISPAGQSSSLLSISTSKATKLQTCRRRKWIDVFVFVFIFSGFVFEDEKIGKEVKLKKWLRRTRRRLSSFDRKIGRMPRCPPRRRPGRCARSRGRAVEPAVPRGRGLGRRAAGARGGGTPRCHAAPLRRLRRSAAGARGGGTPRCHAAPPGGRKSAVERLRCAGPPLPSLPGAAGLAAAGRIRPRDRAARGNGGSKPGGGKLVHEGALRLAGAVPRRTVEGWDGKGHACQVPNQKKSHRLSFLHRSHLKLMQCFFLHIYLFTRTLVTCCCYSLFGR